MTVVEKDDEFSVKCQMFLIRQIRKREFKRKFMYFCCVRSKPKYNYKGNISIEMLNNFRM